MNEKISSLRESFERELEAAKNSEAVEKLRVAYLGKKGSVTELLKGLKDVSGEQKKEMGQHINLLKKQVEEKIGAQIEKIKAAEEEALVASAEQYDVTLPVTEAEGSYHPPWYSASWRKSSPPWASPLRTILKSWTTTTALRL